MSSESDHDAKSEFDFVKIQRKRKLIITEDDDVNLIQDDVIQVHGDHNHLSDGDGDGPGPDGFRCEWPSTMSSKSNRHIGIVLTI